MTDLDTLWPAIARADANAFARFLSAAELPLRRSLLVFARSVDAEAIVQEALLRVWQVAARYQPDGHPNGLLRLAMRIARNLALDECRRQRSAPLAMQADEEPIAKPEPEPDPLLREAMLHCLEQLSGKPRAVLMLRLQSDGQADDVALAVECRMTPNTFLQNLSRARRSFAECLQRRTGVAPFEAQP